MKRAAALLLAFLLAFSAAACSSGTTQSSPSATSPGASPSVPPGDVASPASSSAKGTVGYISDDVDHYARRTYKIAYLYLDALTLEKMHYTAMQNMQKRLNIEVTDFSAANDADKFITNIQVCAQNGYDGMVIEPNADIHDRIYEVATETKIPFVYTVNAYRDKNGANLVPVVVLDQYKNGQTQMQWLYDHYKDYWGANVDESEIVLMTLEYSGNPDLDVRSRGVKDKFAEIFPGNKIIVGDLVTTGYSAQYAYDQCAAIIAANPDVKYWWIAGATEDFGQGAARAVEALGKEETTLIVTSGANVLPIEWDAGYDGCWVASYAVFNYNYVVPALCGLIALIDGRATPETLWQEVRKPGDKATAYTAGDQMVTKATYKTVIAEIEKAFGVTKNES